MWRSRAACNPARLVPRAVSGYEYPKQLKPVLLGARGSILNSSHANGEQLRDRQCIHEFVEFIQCVLQRDECSTCCRL